MSHIEARYNDYKNLLDSIETNKVKLQDMYKTLRQKGDEIRKQTGSVKVTLAAVAPMKEEITALEQTIEQDKNNTDFLYHLYELAKWNATSEELAQWEGIVA